MPNIHIYQIFSIIFATLLLSASAAVAQKSPWPEKSENLQVLPDTTGPMALRSAMMAFTSGLGVRCQYCHVGEPGQPFSTWDFASDDKGTKRATREMLRMVQMINETVSGLDEAATNVTCATCHRGQTKPPPQLDVLLTEVLTEEGADAAVERYDELHERFYGRGLYDFGGRTFTRVARTLIDDGKPDDAITVLNRGAKAYPDDAFIHSYLSDAYLAKEDTTMARIYLEQAIALNPRANHLRQKLDAIASH